MKKIREILKKGLTLLCAFAISIPTGASTVQGDASGFKMIFTPNKDETIFDNYPSIHLSICLYTHSSIEL